MRQLTIDDQLIINRIDAAIERLRARASDNPAGIAISVCNLQEKRAWVLAGTYAIYDAMPDALRAVGAGICEAVKMREPWYSEAAE